jgi:hypothetical protein
VLLKDILKKKRKGNLTKWILFLHDNTTARQPQATQKKLAYLCFHSLDHPLYSPDLSLSDYHLFRGLRNEFNCSHFSSYAEVNAVAEIRLDGQNSEFFRVAYKG